MTISIVDLDDIHSEDPNDAYWAVIERISLASKTYNNENAGPLRLASTLRLAQLDDYDASEQHVWPQTG